MNIIWRFTCMCTAALAWAVGLPAQNVGIGVTAPAATLHIRGQDPNIWFTDIYPLMVQRSAGDTALIVKDNGQVFLSSNINDFATLNLRRPGSTTTPHLLLEQQLAGGLATIEFSNQGGTFYWDGVNNSTPGSSFMGMFANGVGYLWYTNSAGNTGIRTTSPQDRLDVNGDVRFNGDLRLGGAAQAGYYVSSNGTSGNAYYRSYKDVVTSVTDTFTSVGVYISGPGSTEVASAFSLLTDTAKAVVAANINLRPISNFCAPFCGPSDVIVELAAKSIFNGVDLAITRQSLRLENTKTQSVSIKTMFLLRPDFNFPNAGQVSFELRLRLISGPGVECSPPFPESVRNKLSVKVIQQPN